MWSKPLSPKLLLDSGFIPSPTPHLVSSPWFSVRLALLFGHPSIPDHLTYLQAQDKPQLFGDTWTKLSKEAPLLLFTSAHKSQMDIICQSQKLLRSKDLLSLLFFYQKLLKDISSELILNYTTLLSYCRFHLLLLPSII